MEQFIKISRWMTRLGLNSQQMLAFAIIHAYTQFKGKFDGDIPWLSGWICASNDEVEQALSELVEMRMLEEARDRFGKLYYVSKLLPQDPPGRRSHNNINNIGTIGSIEKIKNDNKDPIVPIKDVLSSFTIGDIGPIDMSGPDDGCDNARDISSSKGSEDKPKENILSSEDMMKLLGDARDITAVPLEVLRERVKALKEENS